MENEKKQASSPSRRDDLPIGRDTENILKEWMKMSENVPKVYRHTIYPLVLTTLAQMISDIYFANAVKDERKWHLMNYIARLQSVKGLTRALHEAMVISHRKAHHLFDLYEGVSQQAVKWKNYSRNG